MNIQETYWSKAKEYMKRNELWNTPLGVQAWHEILNGLKFDEIQSVLECGSNIGRNLSLLSDKSLLPDAKLSALDVNRDALEILASRLKVENVYHSSISNAVVEQTFDLVFTCGVLIHISPTELESAARKIVEMSRKYIIIAEYFSREPQEVSYRGQSSLLWKRDFGKFFVDHFQLEVVKYGFLWGHIYDSAGFDDVTFWVLKK